EAKNVDNAVVLARLFNEASGQKAPSKKHGLFISRPLDTSELYHKLGAAAGCKKRKRTQNTNNRLKMICFVRMPF
ncbi:MAG: hypothetical protein ACJATN_002357, partial [Neolewinella sp.]